MEELPLSKDIEAKEMPEAGEAGDLIESKGQMGFILSDKDFQNSKPSPEELAWFQAVRRDLEFPGWMALWATVGFYLSFVALHAFPPTEILDLDYRRQGVPLNLWLQFHILFSPIGLWAYFSWRHFRVRSAEKECTSLGCDDPSGLLLPVSASRSLEPGKTYEAEVVNIHWREPIFGGNGGVYDILLRIEGWKFSPQDRLERTNRPVGWLLFLLFQVCWPILFLRNGWLTIPPAVNPHPILQAGLGTVVGAWGLAILWQVLRLILWSGKRVEWLARIALLVGVVWVFQAQDSRIAREGVQGWARVENTGSSKTITGGRESGRTVESVTSSLVFDGVEHRLPDGYGPPGDGAVVPVVFLQDGTGFLLGRTSDRFLMLHGVTVERILEMGIWLVLGWCIVFPFCFYGLRSEMARIPLWSEVIRLLLIAGVVALGSMLFPRRIAEIASPNEEARAKWDEVNAQVSVQSRPVFQEFTDSLRLVGMTRSGSDWCLEFDRTDKPGAEPLRLIRAVNYTGTDSLAEYDGWYRLKWLPAPSGTGCGLLVTAMGPYREADVAFEKWIKRRH